MRQRIPEKTLYLCAGCVDTLGAVTGMYAFCRKARHPRSRSGLNAMAAVQIVAGAAVMIVFLKHYV